MPGKEYGPKHPNPPAPDSTPPSALDSLLARYGRQPQATGGASQPVSPPPPPRKPSTAKDHVDAVVNGAAFNWAPEASAGVAWLADRLPFVGSDSSYSAMRDERRARIENHRANHPVGSVLEEIGGGIVAGGLAGAGRVGATEAATRAPSLLRSALSAGKLVGTGAAIGGVAGAGNAGPGHRIEGAEQGAKYGAAFAPLAYLGGKGVSAGAGYLMDITGARTGFSRALPGVQRWAGLPVSEVASESRPPVQGTFSPRVASTPTVQPSAAGTAAKAVARDNIVKRGVRAAAQAGLLPQTVDQRAQGLIARKMGAAGLTADDVAARAASHPEAVPVTLADLLDKKGARLTRMARTYGDQAQDIIDPALDVRQEGATDRVVGALRSASGTGADDPIAVEQRLAAARKQADHVNYEQAYAEPDLTDPAVLDIFANPKVREAYARANKLVSIDEEPLPALRKAGASTPNSPTGTAAPVVPTRVTLNNPTDPRLVGTKVEGRMYHGTASGYDNMDLSKADPEALKGAGGYFTNSTDAANGYTEKGADLLKHFTPDDLRARIAQRAQHLADRSVTGDARAKLALYQRMDEEALSASEHFGPNVRPARLALRRPFDEDKARLATVPPSFRKAIESHYGGGLLPSEPVTYEMLAEVFGGKVKATAALKDAGYDGILHTGGTNTPGTKPHQVAIVFSDTQIIPEYAPPVQAGQTGVRGAVQPPRATFRGAPTSDGEAPASVSVRGMDQTKKQLDRIGRSAASSPEDALRQDEARRVGNVLRPALDAADAQRPAYGAARQGHAQAMRLEEAMTLAGDGMPNHPTLGKVPKFLHADAPTVRRVVQSLSDSPVTLADGTVTSERELYRLHAVQDLAQQARSTGDGRDVTRRLFGSPDGRDKLKALLGDDQAKFQQLEQALSTERGFAKTRNGVQGGSNTADKLAEGDELGSAPLPVQAAGLLSPSAWLKALSENHVTGALRGVNAATADALAPRMVAGAEGGASGRASLQQQIADLRAAQAAEAQRVARARLLSRGAANAAGARGGSRSQ